MSLYFKKISKRLRGEPMEGGARTYKNFKWLGETQRR